MPVQQLSLRSQQVRTSSAATSKRTTVRVFAAARPQQVQGQQMEVSRRELFTLGAAAAVAVPLLTTAGPAQAGLFDPRSGQRAEFGAMAEGVLSQFLDAADSTPCVRLVFNDAGTFDFATKTGGMDGSVVLSEELDRPENAGLKPTVEKLRKAKEAIDAKSTVGPISWADLLVLAGKVSTQKKWAEIKIARAETPSGGAIIAENYKAAWPTPLGRIDSTTPAPAGRIPAPGAPVEDIKKYLLALGSDPAVQPGPFTAKPTFWERPGFLIWTQTSLDPEAEEARFAAADKVYADTKRKYDNSRNTITRTDYEVDFINLYTSVSLLGAKFNPDAYAKA